MRDSPPPPPPQRFPWALLVFLLGYVVLLVVVSRFYLIPALEVRADATSPERRLLSASSALLLAVILCIVLMGMVLVLRVRRFFQPRTTIAQTRVVDAWAESGKRLNPPDRSP